jgi:VanZ family protein
MILCRWVAWLLVLTVVVFTLSPIELRPVTHAPASLERFAAFAAISAVFCLGYPKKRFGILVLLAGFIGLLEVAQTEAPGRHGSLPDGLVKASGALLGAAFATIVMRGRRVP